LLSAGPGLKGIHTSGEASVSEARVIVNCVTRKKLATIQTVKKVKVPPQQKQQKQQTNNPKQ
jgi:hypothetical protein